MSKRKIVITERDRRRLETLLTSDLVKAIGPKAYLSDLRHELDRAEVVASNEVCADVVTMNSTVRLHDVESNVTDTYTLVYPDQANILDGKLSILAPIGTAILGYRVGDVVRWQVPSGKRRFKIEEVLYQPEREGALYL